ncbi:MAG: MarR family transcriptional regulator [Sphaerochaeta sp.]|jgi:DNA-binding MarR family transcriptional regulator
MKQSLGRLVAILHRRNIAYLNNALKPFDLTSGEVGIMRSLYMQEDRTQEELSLLLSIDKAAIARAVKSLEKKEYLRRICDSRDKRCNRLFLTDKAKDLQSSIEPIIDVWNQSIEEEIGSTAYNELCLSLYTALEATDQE